MLSYDTPPVLSVTQISRYLKEVLASDEILQDVWVRGEISGCKTFSSGHCYFTLKDAEAQLPCVFFKYSRLRSDAPDLRDGMAIAANGRVSLYERDGKLQLYVEQVELIGEGALFLRFEQLKARLAAEGLFEEERKRPIPSQPSVVGIVTSLQAAALRDMVRVLRTRYPLAEVLLSPTLVQGAEAPAAIAAALDLLNEQGEADVILVARGGGSLEELWAFNEEVVARAIARSAVPVVTGVGHETDFTIADFVADLRASTPTAAASAVVPDASYWRDDLDAVRERLDYLIAARVVTERDTLRASRHQLDRASPQRRIQDARQHVDEAHQALTRGIGHVLAMRGERLRGAALRLHALSPLQTLGRGFAVVRRQSDGALVTSVAQVAPGQGIAV